MKFQRTKYGYTLDGECLRNCGGLHVTFKYGEREYLGETLSSYRDDVTGCVRLKVRHFNGEPWDVDPPILDVDVLERTWDDRKGS